MWKPEAREKWKNEKRENGTLVSKVFSYNKHRPYSETEGDFVFSRNENVVILYCFRLDLKTNYKFFNDTFHFNMKCIIIIWKER